MGQARLKRDIKQAQIRSPVPVPGLMAHLPVSDQGFIVPAFVQWLDEARKPVAPGQGTPDFRVIDSKFLGKAIQESRCWICGNLFRRHQYLASVVGPMCTVNRVSSEPPAHLNCALYALKVCPFLTVPSRGRRERDLPETTSAPGIPIARNPGVLALWIAETITFNVPTRLFTLSEPTEITWWTQGRLATRDEVVAAFEAGLPTLRRMCDLEENAPEAHAQLNHQIEQAMQLLPKN